MAKQASNLTYHFENPNTTKEFRELLKRIIIEKLIARHPDRLTHQA